MPSGFGSATLAIAQRTILRGELPVLVVVHDEEDDWLFGDGVSDPNAEGACGVVHIGHVVELDASVEETAGLAKGQVATRLHPGGTWQVSDWRYGEPW